jgi:hypothetical protein
MVAMEFGGIRSRWFATAEWRDGGLWLPGRPTRHSADLLLRPDGVELRRGDAVCRLSWVGYARGDWVVTHHTAYRNPSGVAVVLPDPVEAGAAAVWARTRTVRNRVRSVNAPSGWVIPLSTRVSDGWAGLAERDTLTALVTLLATAEKARARLTDPDTVAALIADMATGAFAAREECVGGRRTTFEILGALRRLGYRHRNGGRPVPGWTADVETVVADVRRSLAANRYVRGLHFPEERIRAKVLREYINVKPWPFAALTTPPADARRPLEGVTDAPAARGRKE